MVVLSEALVKSKTKLERLEEVRNLNVCGQGIDDVSIFKQTPSVEVLSLSVNRLTSLRHLAFCSQLKQLYLRANAITDLTEIRYLMSLQQLTTLWLADNPCTKLPHYRAVVVANLPKLENLDNVAINEADRRAAKGVRLLQPVTAADVLAEEQEAAEQALLEDTQQYAVLQDTQLHSPQQLHSPRQPHAPTCSPRANAAATPAAASPHQKIPATKAVSLSEHTPHRNTDPPRGSDTSSSIPTAEGAAAHSRAGPAARAVRSSSSSTNQASPLQAAAHSALPSAAGTYRSSVDRELCAEPSQQSRSHSVTPRDLGNPSSTGLNVVTGPGEAADVTGQQLYGEHSCIAGLRQQAYQPHLQQHEEQHKMWLPGGAEQACQHTTGVSCNQQKQQHSQWRAASGAEHAASSCSGSPVSRTNVLYAVMALLGELDASGLSIVQREVQLRLLEHQGA